MTIAKEIQMISKNANDAIFRAEKLTSNISQNWKEESTVFIFNDDSILVVQNANVTAYDSLEILLESNP